MKRIYLKWLTLLLILFTGFVRPSYAQNCPLLVHNEYTDFNSSSNPGTPTTLWLNVHTKLSGQLDNNGDYLLFTGGTLTLNGITSTPMVTNYPIPSGKIIADNSVSSPITYYDVISNMWITRVPLNYSSSDIFLTAAIVNSSTGFVAGAGKNSVINGYFYSNVPIFSSSWMYGLAAYQPEFTYSAVDAPGAVSAIDGDGGHGAGTPLTELGNLVAGGSGGGGSNFTGSMSSTDGYTACQGSQIPPTCIGQAATFGILALNNGTLTINSGTTLNANVGYSSGVTSGTNQKVTTFNGTVYVSSTVGSFVYTPATFQPSGGIIQNNAGADAMLNQANIDAVNASNNYAGLASDYVFGPVTTDLTINRVDPVTVVQMASLSYNSNILDLVGTPGGDDAFIINVLGNFDFSQSEVRLTNVRPERVVFNFPNASNIDINKDATIFNGTILAPTGSVIYHNPATFNGAIIAKSIAVHSDFNLTQKSLDIPCETPGGVASIGDFVWNDTNHNGIQDNGEPGIPNVTVELHKCSDQGLVGSTITDANGIYMFTNLNPGDYYVKVITPAGYTISPMDQGGNDATDSDINPSTGQTTCITLAAGTNNMTVDAGLYPAPASLGDLIWNDANQNGIQDNGELGISGVTVELHKCSDNSLVATTTTNASGIYSFTNLTPDQYYVKVIIPSGYSVSPMDQGGNDATDSDINSSGQTACVTLTAGENNTTVDGGLYPTPPLLGSIGDFVWNDANHNGIQDVGEVGIPNVAVELHNSSGIVATTTTDGTGHYLFSNLPAGNYYVHFTPPAGYTITLINQGGNDALDSDIGGDGNTNWITLAAGENNMTVDAGMYPTPPQPASLGDFVWDDLNHNGIQDQGEPGIFNVTVILQKCSDNTIVATTTTDALGKYSFTNLTPGDYYVTFVIPSGYTLSPALQGSDRSIDSNPDPTGKTACVTLASGENNTTVDAGMYPTPPQTGSIGDFVWNDTNHNGIQDVGELGIPNVTVQLYKCSDNSLVATTTTDANGGYLFSNLPADIYSVKFTVPAGYTVSPALQGGDPTKDSNPDATGTVNCFTLTVGQNNLTIDAGMYPTPPAPASIGDFVWNDANHNGIQDAGELGIPNVTVELHKCSDNSLVGTTTTNANGIYSFTNLTPDQYYVKVIVPSGYTVSPSNAGANDAVDSDIDMTTGQTACYTLTAGENNTTVDAGLYPTPPPTGNIGDFVWNDTNHNGIQDAGELGIPNVTVQLYKCSDNSLVATTVTNANGAYSFTNLTAGQYYVQFVVPAGYTVSPALQGGNTALDSNPDGTGKTTCISLAAGENNMTIDAGMYPTPPNTASIGDFVWNDANHNGIQDAGELGIPNVTVELHKCSDNSLVGTTTTNANGIYSFTNLAPGQYYVKVITPSGYTISPMDQGGNDALDSDINTSGQTACVTLNAGDNNTTVDAGLYPTPPQTATIGDFVWNDTNHNGIQDAGEPGIPWVVVYLFDCTTNLMVNAATTDANGHYSFTVNPGTYYVQFAIPSGYTVSPALQGGNTALDSNPDATGKTACVTVAAGENNTTIDAGMYPAPPQTGSIGDFVWNDTNHNGIQDAGEAGIPNVTVILKKCSDNSTVATTTTNANGIYSFTNVPAGDYYVTFVVPSGYTVSPINQGSNDALDSDIGGDGNTACFNLAAGQNNTTIDAGLYPTPPNTGSIGDFVWNDTNHNGIQDQGEPGIPNVTVELHKCSDNSLVATTTTNANGIYSFTNLAPGQYYVKVITPSGYTVSLMDQGGNDALDSDINSSGQTVCITLNAGDNNTTVDAGLYPTQPGTASIGDFVWNDLNHNGIQEPGEVGIPNITVELHKCSDNSLVATTTTNANGLYSFTNLAPGDYYVKVVLPYGYGVSPANQGSDDSKDSDLGLDGKTACVTLLAGQNNTTVDAGLYPICPTPVSIGDFVWNDLNHNGIQDQGEPGLSGITVKLYKCSDNSLVATTVTDASGHYTFTNLPVDSYYIQVVVPAGYVVSPINQGSDDALDSDIAADGKTACYTLIANQSNTTVDAGLYIPTQQNACIGDFVWNDLNHNGIQDQGEPGIPNVTVILKKCIDNSTVATTTTDASGHYTFTNVSAGDYYVQFVVPAGYTVSPALQGGNTTLDSNPDATGKTACFNLAAGAFDNTIDAGMYSTPQQPASIGDFVWNDTNNNGIQDAGEGGIPNITVQLYKCSDNSLVATTTTDASGHYSFTNLTPGDYYIKVTLPSGYGVSPANQGSDDTRDSDIGVDGKSACVTLAAGQNNTTVDAGLAPICPVYSTIGDFVWNDLNNNGIQDQGEPGIPNVTVQLYKCSDNSLVATTTTNANGNYSFTNIPAGDYYVKVIIPAGYTVSPVNQGSDDNKDSDIGADGKTVCFTVIAGQNYNNIDAGLNQPPSADLVIVKTVSTPNPQCGQTFSYTIKVTNNGPSTASSVSVSDILPTPLVYVSSSATMGTYNNSTGLWNFGSLTAGSSATLTLNVKPDCGQSGQSTIDLGPAEGYNLFVLGSLSQGSAITQGKVAIGGDAFFTAYTTIGNTLPANSGNVLVVGNNLQFASGAVHNGNVVYGGTTNLPTGSVTIDGGTLTQGHPIDFVAALSYEQNLSASLAAYTVNGTTTFQWGQLTLTGTDPLLNVFSVSGADMSAANNIVINVPNGSVVLVNISGQQVTMQGGLTVNGAPASNVIYNFYQAYDLTIKGMSVIGTILAPMASLNLQSATITGEAIVYSLCGSGQFNNSPFVGNIPYTADVTNTAVIASSVPSDPNMTNNTSSVTATISNYIAGGGNGGNGGNGGDGGNGSWSEIAMINYEIIYALAFDGNIMYAGTMGGHVYKSTDFGQTWTAMSQGMTGSLIWNLYVCSAHNLFAATEKGLFIFKNGQWELTALSGKDVHDVVTIGNVLYAATWGGGVYVTNDLGVTFTQINNGLGVYLTVQALTVFNGELYAGTVGGGIFKYSASSNSWMKVSTGYEVIWAMASTSSKIFAGSYGAGLFQSPDGMSWANVTTLSSAPYIYSLEVDGTGKIYASSWTSGVYTSTDNGLTWTPMGLGGMGVTAIAVSPKSDKVFAATKSGKLYMIKGSTTSVHEKAGIPKDYSLTQNYPNPFNPSTTIEFGLPSEGRYTLKVYNLLGQEVATLLNNDLSAGYHSVSFNAQNLSSGTYIYRLTGANVTITKKMVLMK